MTLDEPCISGTVVLDQRRVIEELIGAEPLQRAVERLSEPMQREYTGLTPLSWCRVTTVNALTRALADELGRDASNLQVEIVRHGIERTLTTVWRVLMRLTSDEALVRRTAIIYSKTLNVGSIRVAFAEKGSGRVLLTGWSEMTELDLLALATGIETVLRVAGRKQVHVTWSGTPPHIEYAVSWRP